MQEAVIPQGETLVDKAVTIACGMILAKTGFYFAFGGMPGRTIADYIRRVYEVRRFAIWLHRAKLCLKKLRLSANSCEAFSHSIRIKLTAIWKTAGRNSSLLICGSCILLCDIP